jgi:predicted exporter
MESEPAIFAGAVFSLFGGALLAWTVTRVRRHRPVALGVNPVASATLASVAAVLALAAGTWCFTRL